MRHPRLDIVALFVNSISNKKLLFILDLKHLFRKSIKLSYQSYLEDILDVASNDLTSKPNTKKLFTLLKHFKTRFSLCCTSTKHTIISIRTMEPLFLMNSSSLSSLWHMKLQESTDADRSMLDITVISKGIKKLL